MANVNALLSERLKKNEPSSKMAALAEKSAAGGLSSFNGLFHVQELPLNEKLALEVLLKTYALNNSENFSTDLKTLISITSEIKAINHQAALLHGERIKKVHALLTNYKEGAFSSWLIATYGNRQTPYNLMQYFEFYQRVPPPLKAQLEKMPRQAIYSLATREGDLEAKLKFISSFQGETKQVLLIKIRDLFPLRELDKRGEKHAENAICLLEKARVILERKGLRLNSKQKETLKELLTSLSSLIKTK